MVTCLFLFLAVWAEDPQSAVFYGPAWSSSSSPDFTVRTGGTRPGPAGIGSAPRGTLQDEVVEDDVSLSQTDVGSSDSPVFVK